MEEVGSQERGRNKIKEQKKEGQHGGGGEEVMGLFRGF